MVNIRLGTWGRRMPHNFCLCLIVWNFQRIDETMEANTMLHKLNIVLNSTNTNLTICHIWRAAKVPRVKNIKDLSSSRALVILISKKSFTLFLVAKLANIFEQSQICADGCVIIKQKNSSSADGGPRSPSAHAWRVRSSPHRHYRKFFGARVCRVTFRHLSQPLRSHIRSFGTLGQLLKFSKKTPQQTKNSPQGQG